MSRPAPVSHSAPMPMPGPVADAFEGVPEAHRQTLLAARLMILEAARNDPRVALLEEALRWGDPAYITKTGSTIRLAIEKTTGAPAVFFNCKTTLVEGFRHRFGDALHYVKNRAVVLEDVEAQGPLLESCIAEALTYHLDT